MNQRTRLAFLPLESRETPATLTVTVKGDNLIANAQLTLREAIRTVNVGSTVDLTTSEKSYVSGTLGSNDTIVFADALVGTLGTTITLGQSLGTLNISKPMSIIGSTQAASFVAISGNDTVGVFDSNIPYGVFKLSNLTVQNSVGSSLIANNMTAIDNCVFRDNNTTITVGNGGAISVSLGNLSVTNSVFTNNSAVSGGAIYYSSGDTSQNTLTVSNSQFFKNVATNGGGGAVFLSKFQSGVLVDSTFGGQLNANTASSGNGGAINNAGTIRIANTGLSGNRALLGGALFNSGSVAVENCSIAKNTADNGGGIYTVGNLTLLGSLLLLNHAEAGSPKGNGGGIFVGVEGTVNVTNSTLTSNTTEISGGGLFFNSDDTSSITNSRIVNSTITANLSNEVAGSGGSGGGIYIKTSKTHLQLFNTIVAGNVDTTGSQTPNDISGAIFSPSTNNLIGNAATAGGLTNGNQNNIVGLNGVGTRPIETILNPTLTGTGVRRTHALVQNSLAIGAGSATVPGYIAYDQRESPRGINADAPDIGAYEVQHPLTPVGVPQTYARTFLPKPSATQNEAFIKGLYQSTLLRAAEPAGLQGWLDIMNAGTQTIQQIAYGFVNSTENRQGQVSFFYRYFLNREPDTAGLNFHVARLQSGVDEAQLMSEFILSQEYSASSTNAQFVNLMYYAILGRQADTAGYNGWLNSLNSGTLRATVVNAFVRSAEGITRVVNSYFAAYLKRAATTTELNQFNGLVNSQTFGITASQILGSAEFLTAAGQNLT